MGPPKWRENLRQIIPKIPLGRFAGKGWITATFSLAATHCHRSSQWWALYLRRALACNPPESPWVEGCRKEFPSTQPVEISWTLAGECRIYVIPASPNLAERWSLLNTRDCTKLQQLCVCPINQDESNITVITNRTVYQQYSTIILFAWYLLYLSLINTIIVNQ